MFSNLIEYRQSFKNYFKGIAPLMSSFYSLMRDRSNLLVPPFCTIIPTYKCNYNCLHCTLKEKIKCGEELSKEELVDVAKQIGKSKIWVVSIDGGEPFLRDDLFELVKVLKNYGKLIYIFTNGSLLESYIDDVIRYKVDFLGVSFDSHKSTLHDKLRGFDGAFRKALKAVELLKKKRKGKYPIIDIKGIINKSNFGDLISYIEFFKDVGDNIKLQPIHNNVLHSPKSADLLFKKEDELKFRNSLDILMKKYKLQRNDYYRLMPDFLFNPNRLLAEGKFKCLFSSAFCVHIQPWGDVTICEGREDTSIGNIRRTKFIELWRSKKTIEKQRALRFKKDNCICWLANGQVFNQFLLKIYNFIRSKHS